MTGQRFIEIVNPILEQRGIKKGAFCKAIGVSPNMYGNYRNGTKPGYEVIEATEKYLGIRFSDYEKSEETPNDEELKELLKEAARKKIEDYARKRGVLSEVLSKPAKPHESST